MCGIIGFSGENEYLLKSMLATINHRGPDDSGIYVNDNISLGHKRLSIIDLNTGKQPIFNEKKDVIVVYNGEIYNFLLLKQKLKKAGHRFLTNTDTEVIVHAYEEWGIDCVKYFDGMFAFALYDIKKKRLILARDPNGIKPLYYWQNGKEIVFGSEIKPFYKHPEFKKQINTRLFNAYLVYRYIPEPHTLIEGINKLPRSNILIYENKKIIIKSYSPITKKILNYDIKTLKKYLELSVKKRLLADVPIGVFLSGGLDSGLITGIMNKYHDTIKTFTVGYAREDFPDEIDAAKKTADYFSTDHKEVLLKENPLFNLKKLMYSMDEPIADPSAAPTKLLSEYASRKVKVVLVGEGADEMFGGYEHYRFGKISKLAKPIPSSVVKFGVRKGLSITPKSIKNKIFKYSEGLGIKGEERASEVFAEKDYKKKYLLLTGNFSPNEAKKIQKKNYINPEDFLPKKKKTIVDSFQKFDRETFLLSLLQKADRMTMAHSLEARVPFLDNQLVNFAQGLPINKKLSFFNDKIMLRNYANKTFPGLLEGRKKSRFFPPIVSWIKEYHKSEDLKKTLKIPEINTVVTKKIIKNYDKAPIYYARQLYTIMCLNEWLKNEK